MIEEEEADVTLRKSPDNYLLSSDKKNELY